MRRRVTGQQVLVCESRSVGCGNNEQSGERAAECLRPSRRRTRTSRDEDLEPVDLPSRERPAQAQREQALLDHAEVGHLRQRGWKDTTPRSASKPTGFEQVCALTRLDGDCGGVPDAAGVDGVHGEGVVGRGVQLGHHGGADVGLQINLVAEGEAACQGRGGLVRPRPASGGAAPTRLRWKSSRWPLGSRGVTKRR